MAKRGISVGHATIHRWIVRYSPELLEQFNLRKRAVTGKWHIDETYIRVRGYWTYLYRAVDSSGATIEFWLSETRNLAAAKGFVRQALKRHSRPDQIVIDDSQTHREAVTPQTSSGSVMTQAGSDPDTVECLSEQPH